MLGPVVPGKRPTATDSALNTATHSTARSSVCWAGGKIAMPSKSLSRKKPHGGATLVRKRGGDEPVNSARKSGGSGLPHKESQRGTVSPRPKSPQQRMRVPEAMRLHNLDEEQFAKRLHGLICTLSKDKDNSKLFLDGLKEWARHLAPDRSADRVSSEMPVAIQVVHNIPRPIREAPAQNPTPDKVESAGK